MNLNSTSTNTLLILGNGFDRNCGLNSTFDDFLNVYTHPYKYYKNYFKDNGKYTLYEAKVAQRDFHNDIKRIRREFKYIRQGPHHTNYNLRTFKDLLYGYKQWNPYFSNFWECYLSLLKGINMPVSHIMWDDIERQISHLCKSFEAYNSKHLLINNHNNVISIIHLFCLFLNDNTRNERVHIFHKNQGYLKPVYYLEDFVYSMPYHENYHVNTLLSMALIIAFEYFGLKQYIDNYKRDTETYSSAFYRFLFSQLKDFSNDFSNYLKSNIKVTNKRGADKGFFMRREKGLSKLCNKPYNLLTFNYTGRPKDDKCINYLPIHSDVNNLPIIGINDNSCHDANGNKEFVDFSKKCQIIMHGPHYPTNNTLNDIIPKNVTCIKIYGHSLSNDDFPYFTEIFNMCHLKDGHVKLIFYFTNYTGCGPDHEEHFRREVFDYMDKYSSSIRNMLYNNHKLRIIPINW